MPRHPDDSGFHLLAPNFDELFDASSSLKNLQVDALSSSLKLWHNLWGPSRTFGTPSSHATFGRRRSPTVAPRGRGPTPAGRTLEKTKIGQDICAKASPPKVGGGRDPKVCCYTCHGMICPRSDFSLFLPLCEQCEVTPPINGGGEDRPLSRSYSLRTFARLSNFDTRRFLIRPSLWVVKATCSIPFFAAVVEREGLFC